MSESGATFAPIERQTVSAAVRDALRAAITSGEIPPGAPLPSERELSEQFNVARTSVREAVQALLSLGLIEKRGNRSHVVERLPDIRFDAADRRKQQVVELFEVRQITELPMARLATARATPEQRAELQRIASAFSPDMSLEEFRRLDRQFHQTLAAASGNPTLAELYHKVLDTLFASQEFLGLLGSDENKAAVRKVIADSCAAHQAIARAVASGDVQAAEDAVNRHLRDVEDQMVQTMV